MLMQEGTESQIKKDLIAEISNLEKNYEVIKKFLAAESEFDILEIGSALQSFRDGLNRASAFILALYTLRKQQVKIPWEQLFISLDYALATINLSPTTKQVASLRAILAMSASQIEQVMSYFYSLKLSLKQ